MLGILIKFRSKLYDQSRHSLYAGVMLDFLTDSLTHLKLSRYRDPQIQVDENYSYLFNFIPNINKSLCLNTHFIPNNWFILLIKKT